MLRRSLHIFCFIAVAVSVAAAQACLLSHLVPELSDESRAIGNRNHSGLTPAEYVEQNGDEGKERERVLVYCRADLDQNGPSASAHLCTVDGWSPPALDPVRLACSIAQPLPPQKVGEANRGKGGGGRVPPPTCHLSSLLAGLDPAVNFFHPYQLGAQLSQADALTAFGDGQRDGAIYTLVCPKVWNATAACYHGHWSYPYPTMGVTTGTPYLAPKCSGVAQNCTPRNLDVVFIMDGSNSVSDSDFALGLDFIARITAQLIPAIQVPSKT